MGGLVADKPHDDVRRSSSCTARARRSVRLRMVGMGTVRALPVLAGHTPPLTGWGNVVDVNVSAMPQNPVEKHGGMPMHGNAKTWSVPDLFKVPEGAVWTSFRCRKCWMKFPYIIEAEDGRFYHYRDSDPLGLDKHIDIVAYAVIDGERRDL